MVFYLCLAIVHYHHLCKNFYQLVFHGSVLNFFLLNLFLPLLCLHCLFVVYGYFLSTPSFHSWTCSQFISPSFLLWFLLKCSFSRAICSSNSRVFRRFGFLNTSFAAWLLTWDGWTRFLILSLYRSNSALDVEGLVFLVRRNVFCHLAVAVNGLSFLKSSINGSPEECLPAELPHSLLGLTIFVEPTFRSLRLGSLNEGSLRASSETSSKNKPGGGSEKLRFRAQSKLLCIAE